MTTIDTPVDPAHALRAGEADVERAALASLNALTRVRIHTAAVEPFAAAFFLLLSLSLLILPQGAIPTWGGQRWLFGAFAGMAGLGVLWLSVLSLPRPAHVAASILLVSPQVWLAIDRIQGGAYAAPMLYIFISAAVVLAAALRGREISTERAGDRVPDLLAVALALAVAVQGWALIYDAEDGARLALAATDVSPTLFGITFLVSGTAVLVCQYAPRVLLAIAAFSCGAALVTLNAVVAIEIDSIYWLLGMSVYLRAAATILQPWWQGRVRIDRPALRPLTTAALITAATAPALIIMGFVSYGPGFDPSLETRRIVFGVASAGVLAAFLVAWWSAGWLIHSLQRLIDRIVQMEGGTRGRITPETALTEVRLIGATVEHLVRALDDEAEQREEAMDRLQRTNAELDRALAAKDEFLSLVSHELRTPITMILGNAMVLRRSDSAVSQGDRVQALRDVAEQADRLNRIIDNLLTLARAERGIVPDFEPMIIGRELTVCVDEFRQMEPARKVIYTEDCGNVIVNSEPTCLRQIVTNLLSNAAKYSPATAPIELQATRGRASVTIRVLDRGRGVRADEATQVFDTFYRSELATDVSGLGLGLAVCKRLVEAMGGTIWARPRDGGGTEAGFELPASTDADLDGELATSGAGRE